MWASWVSGGFLSIIGVCTVQHYCASVACIGIIGVGIIGVCKFFVHQMHGLLLKMIGVCRIFFKL